MTTSDLKLVEITDPPVVGNTLYVEQYLGDQASVFLSLCQTGEDPVAKGLAMEIRREAAVQLRDWLNAVLESAAS